MISNSVFNFTITLVVFYAIAMGMILAQLFNALRVRKYFYRFDWIPSYIGLLVVFSFYMMLLICVTCKILDPLQSSVLSGFIGPMAVCLYFVFLSRYAKEPKPSMYFYLIFGTSSALGFVDLLTLMNSGESFALGASSDLPQTYVLKFFGSKNELKPMGLFIYSVTFVSSLYFGIIYFIKFLKIRSAEKLLLVGIACNIVFQLNDMLTTFDLIPLIPLFGLAILPEIFHVNGVLANAVASEKNELSMQLESQKLIAFHQSKLAAIGEISTSIGHEISNPLAISDSIIHRLKRHLKKLEIEDDKTEDFFRKHSDATKRIANIISGLRSLSSSDSNEKEKFDVIKSTCETIDFAKDFYKSNGITLEYESELTSAFTLGFSGRFQQCILNLITNAKDALEKTSHEKRIRIRTHEQQENIVITVEDNGCGISEEHQSKIYDPYFSTKEKKKGTGLGLSLVQLIIEKEHDGNIAFETSSEGTIFSIALPRISESV